MVRVFILYKDKTITSDIYNKFLNTLTPDETLNINKKIRQEDREIILLSRLLLRNILYTYYKIKVTEIEFILGDFGKPYIKNYKNLFFNISHTKDTVALAVSEKEIGVDVEINRNTDILLVSTFFEKSEQEYLLSFSKNERQDVFYQIWTLKESYLKAIGTGLSKSLDSFSVVPVLKGKSNYILDTINQEADTRWVFTLLKITNAFLSVCTTVDSEIEIIEFMNSTEFIGKALPTLRSY